MEILLSLLVLWVVCFGFSLMFGQHRAFVQWTGRAIQGAVAFIWRQSVRFVRWVWRYHWKLVVGLAIGYLAGLYTMGYFR
jgi:hypothetical protein